MSRNFKICQYLIFLLLPVFCYALDGDYLQDNYEPDGGGTLKVQTISGVTSIDATSTSTIQDIAVGGKISGTIGNVTASTDWDDAYDRTKAFNGIFLESFQTSISSDGVTVTLSVEQSGTGDLTMVFSSGQTTLDCTPAQTIELTTGSNSSPQANYIYVLQSTGALTKSTTGFPTTAEHIKIGYFLVPAATYVQSDGLYIHQNWNDHTVDGNNQGHITHIAERLRRSGAVYFSGIDANGTDQDTNSSYFDYISGTSAYFKSATGVIYQMHRQTYSAVDTRSNDIHVTNWNGDPYHNIHALVDITEDANGVTLTNRYFNLVFIGVANETGTYQPILCNLPIGSYSNQTDAEQDSDSYDVLTIPREYGLESSTGFLICRMTLRNQAGNYSHISTLDLRGQTPISASGGASGSQTNFADNVFSVYDESDDTKRINFQASGITANTTVNLTIVSGLTVELESSINQDLTTDSVTAQFGTLSLSGLTTEFIDNVNTINATTKTTFENTLAVGGDTSGTVGNISVSNDSHDHTTTTISGLDISADTNLAGTANQIILTDDTLSLSLLKDLVTTSPLSGGVNDIFIGTDSDVTLLLAASAADKYLYSTGINTWTEGAITTAGRAILDDANATAQIATLGMTSLMDDSMADALHRHSELSASDGSPNPAVQVDATGQVGIGTTPLTPLHVELGSSYILGKSTTGNYNFGLRLERAQSGGSYNHTSFLWSPSSTKDLRIQVDSADVMTFQDGGNVGIGTTSPNADADIAGAAPDLRISSYNTTDAQKGRLEFVKSSDATVGSGVSTVNGEYLGGISFSGYDEDDVERIGAQLIVEQNGDARAGWIPAKYTFYTTNTAGSEGSRFVIDHGGISAPGTVTGTGSYSLDISGVTNVDLYIDENGRMGYIPSTPESKTNIKPLADTSWIYDLNPVDYEARKQAEIITGYMPVYENDEYIDSMPITKTVYTDESSGIKYNGLLAPEVEEVNKELVIYGKDGKPMGVYYDQRLIIPMLKEIQNLRKEIDELKAR